MTTPVDSATLILKLFELRREPVLREARAWFLRDHRDGPARPGRDRGTAGGFARSISKARFGQTRRFLI
jgi:hypothetical protein